MTLRWRVWRAVSPFASAAAVAFVMSCGGDVAGPPQQTITIASITINGSSQNLERGSKITLTAVAKDVSGKIDSVPFVWRSTVDSVASFGLNGVLIAKDTGVTIVTASSLGVTSGPIEIHVVWLGAANIDTIHFNPPNAVDPGVTLADSVRVVVTGAALNGRALPQNATVLFTVTAGGGTVSPRVAAVGSTGIVAAQWTLGPNAGINALTATAIGAVGGVDSLPLPWVNGNPATFTIKTYAPLAIVQGDGQTGSVLSALPVNPSVRLTDSAGKPRAGVPITFTATGNGRVQTTIVPTAVDGLASPGVWTLGDATGDEQLVASVEAAKITLHATATGGTIQYAATQLATAQLATCALTNDQLVACFGRAPQIGTGDTASVSLPTLTKGSVHFSAITGTSSGAHFCGTSTDFSIYCWGLNALVDTSGVVLNTNVPTRLPGNIGWLQVTAGAQHNCGLAIDHTAYCWGDDTFGQLGDNGSGQHYVPQPVAGGFKFSTLTAGGSHTCGITVDNIAFCWGANASAQIGDGTQANRGGPTAVTGGLKFQSIGAGSAFTCALSGGTVYCWGSIINQLVPTSYPLAPSFSSLSAGASHACALTSDGTAYCWGDNSAGQLGDSTTTSRNVPTAVVTTLKFKSVSAGYQHTCAITTDGFVACWGRNQYGEIGVSVPTGAPTPLIQLTPRFVVLSVTP